ncbi:MAG: hypothetical protein ACJ739_01825 [Acidimicrobiales bacterium]
MTAISTLSEEEVDALVSGHTPVGRGDLAPVAEALTTLRRQVAEEPVPTVGYPLRSAMARRAAPPAPSTPRSLAVTAVASAVTVLALAGAADALPAPVQEAVADVGDLVGVEVPHSSTEHSLEERGAAASTVHPASTEAEDEGTEPKAERAPLTVPAGAIAPGPGSPGDDEAASPDSSPGQPDPASGEDQRAPEDERGDHSPSDADDAAEAGTDGGSGGASAPVDAGSGHDQADEESDHGSTDDPRPPVRVAPVTAKGA